MTEFVWRWGFVSLILLAGDDHKQQQPGDNRLGTGDGHRRQHKQRQRRKHGDIDEHKHKQQRKEFQPGTPIWKSALRDHSRQRESEEESEKSSSTKK